MIKHKILFVAGARPNFIKLAPILNKIKKFSDFSISFVHTGQHYDRNLSSLFFEELNIPNPNYNLRVGSASHALQTAQIMIKFEPILKKENPNLVVVVGDVNSTLAASLTAKKMHYKIAHIESGLRSFDQSMPEEVNRIITDHLSDYLFTTEIDAEINLVREGISKNKIFHVGNIMIDTLLANLNKAKKLNVYSQHGLSKKKYALVTLHRAENVDSIVNISKISKILKKVQNKMPILFPVHPRAFNKIKQYIKPNIHNNIIVSEPLGYLEFINAMINSKFVLTDSGGVQEETSVLKVPCLTMRDNTERPATVKIGTNTIVGLNKQNVLKNVELILSNQYKLNSKIPEKWDGLTSERIIQIIRKKI